MLSGNRLKKVSLLSTLSVSLLLLPPALACGGTWDPDGPAPRIGDVKATDASEVIVDLDGFVTHGDAAGNDCGAAIGPLGVGSLQAVAMVDGLGEPIPGFHFEDSPATAESISCFTGEVGQGFSGTLRAPVPHGIPSSLRLAFTLEPGETVADLLKALEGTLVTVGSTDRDGWFDGQHLNTAAIVATGRASADR